MKSAKKSGLAGIMSDLSAAQASKLAVKLPSWAAAGASVCSSLSLEQCSSESAALYKARIARSIMAGGRETRANIALSFSEHGSPLPPESTVADLTGGMGVDSWAFSQIADRVIYNELSPALAQQASRNFRLLGRENITVLNKSAEEALERLEKASIIYLDPDRRAATGAKMVRFEDCRPNLIDLLPSLLEAAPYILVKLSPMLDITQMLWRLSGCVSKIWILSTHRECRELLILISRNISTLAATAKDAKSDQAEGPKTLLPTITVAELHPDGNADELHFELETHPFGQAPSPARTAGIPLVKSSPAPGTYIFEPGAALMKSGCFAQLCARYDLTQLDTSTRLFACPVPLPELEPFGRFRRIIDIRPLSGKTLKEFGREYPRCEITAKNIPMTTDQVRARMGSAPGGDIHIYATSVLGQRMLIALVR